MIAKAADATSPTTTPLIAGKGKIHLADGPGFMRDCLPPDSVHLIFTSPPYPGVKFWTDRGYLEAGLRVTLSRFVRAARRVLTPGGYLVVNIGSIPAGNQGLRSLTDMLQHEATLSLSTMGSTDPLPPLTWRGHIIWDKGCPGPLPPPVFMRRPCIPHITHEELFIYVKGDWHARERSINLSPDQKKWLSRSVWSISPQTGPTRKFTLPFPEALAERVISLFSLPGDIVLDPFCGSGTTCLVAHKLARQFIGIDSDRQCVNHARSLLDQENTNGRT